jgi:segregation and condensation protein B
LKSLDDLPTLAELQDLDDINEQLELPGTPVAAIAADEVTGLPPPATVAVTAEEIVAEVFDDSAEESAEDESISDDPELDAAGEREEGEVPTLVAGPPDSQER